jgi:methionine aminopeptidase
LSIQDEQELLSLKAVGRIVRMVLDAMKAEVRTGDHVLSAHFEHTLVITSGTPILLTAG